MDSIKGMFGGGDDDAIPVEETITEPSEPMGEESAAEPTPEPTGGDDTTGGTDANMDAKKCGNCGADFGTCEHTAQPSMV